MKKLIITKKISVFILLITFHCIAFAEINKGKQKAKNPNQSNLETFLKELAQKKQSATALYNTYLFINEKGKPDRSEETIKYYTDTLFDKMGSLIRTNDYWIYPLAVAKKKYKKENFYNYYYDGQKKNIYVLAIKTKEGFVFQYVLMYSGKIVSLFPTKVIDNGIIGWS
jgi:hypothetical protein